MSENGRLAGRRIWPTKGRWGALAQTLLLSGLLWGLLAIILVGTGSAVRATSTAQEEPETVHVVEAGETLFLIAQQYSTTVDALIVANDIADPSYLYIGQELVIPSPGYQVAAEEEASSDKARVMPKYLSYLIVPSDTLDAVAQRFGTGPRTLAELNGVVNPAGLLAGQQLRVPDSYTGRLHIVGEEETALSLAMRHNLSPWEFLTANNLDSPAALLPGQRVRIPGDSARAVATGGVNKLGDTISVTTGTLPLPFLDLDVGPLPVLTGHTVRVRVNLAEATTVRGVFQDEVLRFATEEDALYALVGIHALAEPGLYTLALLGTDAQRNEVYVTRTLTVASGNYGYEEIILSDDRDAVLDPQAMAAERARLAEVKTVFNPHRYWEGLFSRPLTTELTSLFGTSRLYKSPSYQFYGYHEGNDFGGQIGTPVYAPAAGVVVLAEPLFVRGNAVVVDHGWGVYTGYWHLSEIQVAVGQRVKPGDQIALVGHTGLSTGAHLHWDFWVNGTNVDALQWTEDRFP